MNPEFNGGATAALERFLAGEVSLTPDEDKAAPPVPPQKKSDEVVSVKARFVKFGPEKKWVARVYSPDNLTGRRITLRTKTGEIRIRRLGELIEPYEPNLVSYATYHFAEARDTEFPADLKSQVLNALDTEDVDEVYVALMKVAEHFKLQ